MKPTIQLINALRKAADDLEAGCFYSWSLYDSCNCGILAQALLGIPRNHRLLELGERGYGHWGEAGAACDATGIPMDEVVRLLAAAGLPGNQFSHIENLTDQTILKRAGMDYVEGFNEYHKGGFNMFRRDRTSVLRYFRAWADILEEQLGEQFETRPLALSPAPQSVGLEVGR